MKFLYPEFLYASAAIAIPIIIHLFNFRRYKRVMFTNVKFLKEVQQETKSKQRLKHLLVLAARILAILFLVAAFAQPYIPVAESTVKAGQKSVSIYIDNSFSMDAVGPDGELLQVAKNKARGILEAYQPSDKFQLITNDFDAIGQRLLSKDDFLKRLEEIQSTPTSRKISEVVNKQRSVLNKGEGVENVAYIISDGQQSIADIAEIEKDTTMLLQIVQLKANKRANVSIDSVWLATPFIQLNQPAKLWVKLTNYGENDLEALPVNLKINGVQKALASVNLNANRSEEIEITFTITAPGWQNAEVSVLDNPVVFDDKFYFSFNVAASLPILAINGDTESTFINRVYSLEELYTLTNVSAKQIDYSTFGKYKFIVLNELNDFSTGLQQELKKFCENGGSLLIIPSSKPGTSFTGMNNFLASISVAGYGGIIDGKQAVANVDNEHQLLKGVFEKPTNVTGLLKINKTYKIQSGGLSTQQTLIRLQDGTPFLAEYTVGEGTVYVTSSPFNEEWNNFTQEAGALFVPLMMNMALYSSDVQSLYTVIGKGDLVALTSNVDLKNDINKLRREDFEIIPEFISKDNQSYLSDNGAIKQAGNYELVNESKEVLQIIGYNYDRKESNTQYIDGDELKELAEDKNIKIIDSNTENIARAAILNTEGIQFWWWCIILVLFFLAIEVFLLRFVK